MAALTIIKKDNTTILKSGRKTYGTISFNKNPDYKFVLYLKNSFALSGFESEEAAIKRANELKDSWQSVLSSIKSK